MDKDDVLYIYVCVCVCIRIFIEYYLVLNKNEIMPFVASWMDLEISY